MFGKSSGLVDAYEDWVKWPPGVPGYRVAPEGVAWTTPGSMLRIGYSTEISPTAQLSHLVVVGAGCHIGNGAIIRESSSIGNCTCVMDGAYIGQAATIGDHCTLMENSYIPKTSSLGANSVVGPRSTFVADLGFYEGYRKILCEKNDEPWIASGCRWFKLKQAQAHWERRGRERHITQKLVEFAEYVYESHRDKRAAQAGQIDRK